MNIEIIHQINKLDTKSVWQNLYPWGLIPGWGIKILQTVWCSQKKKLYPFKIRTHSKLRTDKNILKLIKDLYEKPTANITLNGKD